MEFSLNIKRVAILLIYLSMGSVSIAQEFNTQDEEYEANVYDLPYNAITTTPYTLPKGSLVYQNLNLAINTLSYGIHDRLSVSAGYTPISFGSGSVAMSQIKYNFYRDENYALSISNLNFYDFNKLQFGPLGEESRELDIIPIFFLNAAVKNSEHDFWTFGVGAYHADGITNPIFTIGYQNRFSKKVAFIADLWLPFLGTGFFTPLPIPAVGFRFFGKEGITFDIGFPFVGIKIPFIGSK